MPDLSYADELARQLFLLSAAGIGALFGILYPLISDVSAGTYDENNDPAYVLRFVVGLISGAILSQLLDPSRTGELEGLATTTLALLGGFSSSLVYKILASLVRAAESMFSSEPGQPQDSGAISAAEGARVDLLLADERYKLVRRLTDLRAQLPPGSTAELDDLVRDVLRGDT